MTVSPFFRAFCLIGTEETVTVRHHFQNAGSFHRAFEFNALGLLLLLLLLLLLFLLLLVGLPLLALLRFLLLLGLILVQFVKERVDELLAIDRGNFGHIGGRFLDIHRLGFLADAGTLLLGGLLLGLLLGLFGRLVGFLRLLGLCRGFFSRLLRIGRSGLGFAGASGFFRSGRLGSGGCSRVLLRILDGSLLFGGGFLLGLIFLLLGGTTTLARLLLDGFLRLDPRFLVQDGETKLFHVKLFRILDA